MPQFIFSRTIHLKFTYNKATYFFYTSKYIFLTLNTLHYLRTETNSPSPLVTQLNKIKTRKQPTSSKPKIYTTPTVNKHPKTPKLNIHRTNPFKKRHIFVRPVKGRFNRGLSGARFSRDFSRFGPSPEPAIDTGFPPRPFCPVAVSRSGEISGINCFCAHKRRGPLRNQPSETAEDIK